MSKAANLVNIQLDLARANLNRLLDEDEADKELMRLALVNNLLEAAKWARHIPISREED